MEGTKQLIPLRAAGLNTRCAWAPEPVFTLEEAARLLGVRKDSVKKVRKRHQEVGLEVKVGDNLSPTSDTEVWYRQYHTFGPSLTKFGEVKLTLETPGGPQEHVCLTHYGLFRHAIFTHTRQARAYVLNYPRFIEALASGKIKPVNRIADVYAAILNAPHGQMGQAARQAAAQLGKSMRTIWRNCRKIKEGKISPDGTPILLRPGPPKGYMAGIRSADRRSNGG